MTNFLEIPDFEKGTLQKREISTDPSVPIYVATTDPMGEAMELVLSEI